MANATAIVKKASVRRTDEFMKRSVETLAAETRFYRGALIGIDVTGYYCKGDDTQSWVFAGVVRGQEGDPLLPIGTAGADDLQLDIQRPQMFELAISGVAVTDIDKLVYASDDQTGVMTPASLTYANVVGRVRDVVATGIALVEPCYGGVADNVGAARYLAAATASQSLTKYDMNKLIVCPNTAAIALTLPAIADVDLGTQLTFVKTTSDAKALTLTGAGSDKVNGSATDANIDAQYDTITIRAAAANHWHKTSSIIA